MRIALLLLLPLLAQDPVEKARKILEKTPDDPAANLTVGLFYADGAKWDLALPCFEKVKSADIRAAVEAEKKADGNQFTLVEIGDAWAKAIKAGPARQACFDRMNVHYAAAWDKLDDFGKAKLKERLTKLYAPPATGKGSPEAIAGWGGVDGAAARVEVVAQRVHAGNYALKLTPKDLTKGTLAHSKAIPVVAGKKLEVSAWVLADGTDSASDSLKFAVRDTKDGFAWSVAGNVRADLPVWTRISGETVLPAGSLSVEVQIAFNSKAGAMFVDDISMKLDGKELMPKGTFEP
jgi:hypothetical protein